MTDRSRSRSFLIAAGAALFALGGGVGAGAMFAARPVAVMAPVRTTPIAALARADRPMFGDAIVSVRGKVAELYGDRFVLDDGSGRTLVEAGPRGGDDLVALNQVVTVQGRYEHGTVHPEFLVGADGTVTALRPHDRPHGGPHGGPRGPGDRDESQGPGQPPAPGQPMPADGAVPPPPPARG